MDPAQVTGTTTPTATTTPTTTTTPAATTTPTATTTPSATTTPTTTAPTTTPTTTPTTAPTTTGNVAVNTGTPNNAKAPNNAAMYMAQNLARYLGGDLTITSGYRPGAAGAHGARGGNAFDIGHRSNQPVIPLGTVKAAYNSVFNPVTTMAMQETTCYHFQLQPVIIGGVRYTGFRPGLRTPKGKHVK